MKIIPYVWLKDHWSIPHNVIEKIWDMMMEEGTIKTVFCTGSVIHFDGFLKMLQNPKNCVMTQWKDGHIVFIGWTNAHTQNAASIHFNCFKYVWGRSDEVFKSALKYWFSIEKESGEPIFNTIMGMIADDNQRAIKMVQKAGCHMIGTIPNYSTNIYTKKKIGATVLYIERGEI